ncbi:MAG: glycoside hydrolase family 2 TIM barrel-domain containing protein [Planctomycetota bacterium]
MERPSPFTLCSLAALAVPVALAFGPVLDESTRSGDDVTRTEVRRAEEGWQLLVDGEPFYVKGAGVEFGDMEALAAHGANAIRTWRTDNGRRSGKEVLDQAHALGLKVAMGIDVGRERHGFDYDDPSAVAAQLDRIRTEVIALKDHPALILWGIGNELNHHAKNPKVWDAVDEISRMIHDVDPHHLTTTSLSGMDPAVVRLVQERAPDLDVLSVQMYAEIEILPERIAASGWDGPILVTEWGATGYWEVQKTSWGAPIENDSSTKADFYGSRYENSIASQRAQVIGSYVFLWGQKQERTPTWFGMFTEDGRETESIDVMHRIWTGEWPGNRAPRVSGLRLDGRPATASIKLEPGQRVRAEFDVEDPDRDRLGFRWELMLESSSSATGGDRERRPKSIEGRIQGGTKRRISLRAPKEPGAYRLFAYCDDTDGNTAHANVPFLVE